MSVPNDLEDGTIHQIQSYISQKYVDLKRKRERENKREVPADEDEEEEADENRVHTARLFLLQ